MNIRKTITHDRPIVLLGGGGHALSLLEAFPPLTRAIGYTALEPSPKMPVEWLGDDETFRCLFKPEDVVMLCALVYGGRPDLSLRRRIIESFIGYDFATLIAPSAVVTDNCEIGEGAEIMHRAVINRARIGRNAVVNTGAIIEHDCSIGDTSFIGPGAVLGGEVEIGPDCFIGMGTCIRNGVGIAAGTVIGMGSVVTANITQPGTYAGSGNRLRRI